MKVLITLFGVLLIVFALLSGAWFIALLLVLVLYVNIRKNEYFTSS